MKLVADNLNPSNQRFAQALRDRNPGPIQALARRCLDAGAQALDINPGHLSGSRRDRMIWLVETVQDLGQVRLWLDSAQPTVLLESAAACSRPPILNALTAQADRLAVLPELARESGAGLVILLLDERGHAPACLEEKAALATRLCRLATDAGLPWESLICDPVLPHLSWPDADQQITATVELVALLARGELLGRPVATMVGLSNLRSGLRGKLSFAPAEHVLQTLDQAGLEWVLANALDAQVTQALGPW